MTLSVDVHHKLGDFSLDAAFESSGRLTALFGSSGSGKTSLVNLIGGLARPKRGWIVVDGRVLVDTDKGIFLPSHKRRIGYVFQDARLFPHMNVRQNLAYGRWFAPAGERYADEDYVVDLLGIGGLLERRPNLLSGGEKQRVAIGRALIASPRLILMDEPLAALDDARKGEILPYIERLRDETKIPIVYVSHSVAEVGRLATDVVVLASGKILSSGGVAEILSRHDLLPDDERDEAGVLIELEVVSHEAEYGLTLLRSVGGEWRIPGVGLAIGKRVRARIRARDVIVATEQPRGISALNIVPGRIVEIANGVGADCLVVIDCDGDRLVARVTNRSVHLLGLSVGSPVYAIVKAVTFDRANAARPSPAMG